VIDNNLIILRHRTDLDFAEWTTTMTDPLDLAGISSICHHRQPA
jgi:hypothetical protein